MSEIIIILLSILLISLIIEKKIKIPNPLITITLTLIIIAIDKNFMNFINIEVFSEEMLSFIVLLILVDAFVIRFDELKEKWISVFYLAFFSMIISVIIGLLTFNYTFFSNYNLNTGAIIVLFSMCLATDPVAVISTFKQYNVPHKIKFLAESESLFNDAVALIMFSTFGLYLMAGNQLTFEYSIINSSLVIFGSIFVGFIVGSIGLLVLKTTNDVLIELVIILLTAYSAFYLAEHPPFIHVHFSGLLSEIVSIITLTTLIEKSYEKEKELIKREENILIKSSKSKGKNILKKLTSNILKKQNQDNIKEFLSIFAMFINLFLFVSLTIIMDFDKMLFYWKEILLMFLLTTLIRTFIMGKFAFISNKTNKITNIDIKSLLILTFSGIKGGLSIVMLHMLMIKFPNFEYTDMFIAIVSGLVLLSMFFYTIGLILTIKINKKELDREVELEKIQH